MLRNSDDWRLISLVEREANGYNRRESPLIPVISLYRLSQSIKLRTERKVLVEFWINLSLDIGAMILGKLNDYVLRIQPPEASFFCSKLA